MLHDHHNDRNELFNLPINKYTFSCQLTHHCSQNDSMTEANIYLGTIVHEIYPDVEKILNATPHLFYC